MTSERKTLEPAAGLSTTIGFCLSAMDEVRQQLRETVGAMPAAAVNRLAVPGAHSIGALVLHIGEAEWWWMRCVIEGHQLTPADRAQLYWDVLDDPDGFARENYSAQFCLDEIDKLRASVTRRVLASFNDADLERVFTYRDDKRAMVEVSLRWVLHHLVDHEAQHKGQILMLKRMLG